MKLFELARARDLSGNSEAIATIGFVMGRLGRRDEARAGLEQLKQRAATGYVPPYAFAMVHNALGEYDEALEWLERGIEQRDPKMTFLKVAFQWKNLHADPRFQHLLARINLWPDTV